MFIPTETYISDKYTYEYYLNLKFNINSPQKIWKEAIDIFKDRIESRYLFAINLLKKNPDRYSMRKLGFAIVTLQCSLIDTLAKFRYSTNLKENRFIKFLEEYFISGPNKYNIAKKIYIDIRCGIVHSGSTCKKSGLSCEQMDLVSFLPNNSISLDLLILQKKIEEYFYKYVKDLENKNNNELRNNFVHTMNEVCKVK